jgi:hypothetical protein
MNECWLDLPNDIITHIMSYGHPVITKLYTNVLDQLLYHMREFNYHRSNQAKPFNRWYLLPETDYYKYTLRESFLKKHINKNYSDLPYNYGSLPDWRWTINTTTRFRALAWEAAYV